MTTNPSSELPVAMRDSAAQSISQARQAFDSFISAARRTAAMAQGASETANQSAQDVAAHSFQAAEQNVHAAFELAIKLAQAKSVQEALQLQSEYARSQAAAIQAQAKELGGMAQSAAQNAAEQTRSAAQDAMDQPRRSMD